MKLDVLGLLGACSYALDCVEAELVHVVTHHAKRVAYMSVKTAQKLGVEDAAALRDLAACALLHDNALTQYIQEELSGETYRTRLDGELRLGQHCIAGEANILRLPFQTDVKGIILYHHECADGSGPFGKLWQEIPPGARIVHLCDQLDVDCGAALSTEAAWQCVTEFLSKTEGRTVDTECCRAFREAFSENTYRRLGTEGLDELFWSEVPREVRELPFSDVRAVADFFARIVDYKSPFTSTHSVGVARCAQRLSRYMGLGEATAQQMYLAGALHDIGKVAVGNEILEKPGKLTDEEFSQMKHHAAYSYAILSEVRHFETLRDWASFHHERLDGTGYPFGKTAAQLNLQERIMAVADVYQALTEKRPYKDGMPHERAVMILQNMAAKGWLDASVVLAADECFRRQG